MRQPLEDRHISISRAKYTIDYPASFMLVASMNPCPCGYYGHPTKQCICTPHQRHQYMSKISGPLLDRIDLQVEVQPVNFEQMSSKQPGEPSAAIRERVIKARAIQSLRFKNHPGVHCNAQMTTALLHKYAEPDAEGMEKLREAITKMNMSARAYDRIPNPNQSLGRRQVVFYGLLCHNSFILASCCRYCLVIARYVFDNIFTTCSK